MQIYLLSSLFVRFAIAVLASGNINSDSYIYILCGDPQSAECIEIRNNMASSPVSVISLYEIILSVSSYLRIILQHIPLRRRYFIK